MNSWNAGCVDPELEAERAPPHQPPSCSARCLNGAVRAVGGGRGQGLKVGAGGGTRGAKVPRRPWRPHTARTRRARVCKRGSTIHGSKQTPFEASRGRLGRRDRDPPGIGTRISGFRGDLGRVCTPKNPPLPPPGRLLRPPQPPPGGVPVTSRSEACRRDANNYGMRFRAVPGRSGRRKRFGRRLGSRSQSGTPPAAPPAAACDPPAPGGRPSRPPPGP